MNTATLAPPNAIIFIFDPGNPSVEVPAYQDGQLVANTESCLSVVTQADVEGDTTITLSEDEGPASLIEVAGVALMRRLRKWW